MNKLSVIAIVLATTVASGSAFASQEAPESPPAPAATPAPASPAAASPITIRVEQGKVMISDGGAFTAAATGTVVEPGERLMISDGASATVYYNDHCKRAFTTPGVYVIEEAPNCKAPAARMGVATGVAAGAAAIGIAAGTSGGGGDNNNTPPVSR